MQREHSTSDARQKILDCASALFYRQGYQATGINQIIEESGVAKATFYAHFPSKDDLCLAYLQRTSELELDTLRQEMAKRKSSIKKYMTAFELLEPWMRETDFKGCAFLNMVPEVIDPRHPIRSIGPNFYSKFQAMIRDVVEEIVASDSHRYANLKPAIIAQRYCTIFAGTISLCEIFHDIAPLQQGMAMARELLEVC